MLRLRSLFIASTIAAMVAGAAEANAAPGALIVVDAKTGKVLYSSNADASRFPASLTKMMTLYLLFEALDGGKTTLSSRIPISKFAAAQAPTKLGLKPGSTIAVKDAILALVTKSANDIAVAIAEYLGGTEGGFAVQMTLKARAIGMKHTTFRNASGLPNPGQVTTARDMATLGRALQDRFPKHFSYFAAPSFTFKGKRIANHNRLLGKVAGVNGIKTGYTKASGYNLVTSVKRDGRQVVAVVLGGSTGKARDQRMASLIGDYLPKASAGVRTAALVGMTPNTTEVVAEAEAEHTAALVPSPRIKPGSPERGEVVAAAAPAPATVAYELVTAAKVPEPEEETVIEQGDISEEEPAADVPEKPVVAAVTGWKIQISASPSQSSAKAMLDSARAKASKLLASRKPYTEPVSRGGVTLYRARFAGFASKDQARAACTQLAKQKFACLALE